MKRNRLFVAIGFASLIASVALSATGFSSWYFLRMDNENAKPERTIYSVYALKDSYVSDATQNIKSHCKQKYLDLEPDSWVVLPSHTDLSVSEEHYASYFYGWAKNPCSGNSLILGATLAYNQIDETTDRSKIQYRISELATIYSNQETNQFLVYPYLYPYPPDEYATIIIKDSNGYIGCYLISSSDLADYTFEDVQLPQDYPTPASFTVSAVRKGGSSGALSGVIQAGGKLSFGENDSIENYRGARIMFYCR